jgi:hypothetical protein
MPIVDRLISSDDPTVVLKTRRDLLGEPQSALVDLRRSIAETERARQLLGHRRVDGTIATNPYTKWQGPHWTLVLLALIEYPPGDDDLHPLRDQVYDWMFSPEHMQFPRTVFYDDQPERVRRCGSMEGNAIWYSLALGLGDDRTKLLVDRLIDLQWPDGGWNCDKRREARTSSFMETLIPLRGLHAYGQTREYRPALQAAGRAAEFLLERRLLWRKRDGRLLEQFLPIWFPIQFYDPLFVLQVMVEIGMIDDPRCKGALDVLESKRLPDGGFPAEAKNAHTVETRTTRGSWADWGPGGKTRTNELVTVAALAVLKAAGRE